MDKIFSARLDEVVLAEMDRVTHLHHLTKKKFLEEAIRAKVLELEKGSKRDILEETRGAWKRAESAPEIIRQIRSKMNKNFSRRGQP